MPSPPPAEAAQPNASPPSLEWPAPPLPPPPSSTSPSTSTANRILDLWPENHHGPLLLFFDPFSSKFSSFKAEMQNNLSLSGRTLPTTMLAMAATHLILDPHCPQSSWVRQAARPDQHVVRFEWIEGCVHHGFSVPESGYGLDSTDFGGAASSSYPGNGKLREAEERDELERGREMEGEEDERSDSGPDDSSSEDEEGEGEKKDWSSFNLTPRFRIPKANRICHNCLTTTSSDWRILKEKGGALTCGTCRALYYSAQRRHPGTGDAALATRKKNAARSEDEDDDDDGRVDAQAEEDNGDEEYEAVASGPLLSSKNSKRRASRPWSATEKQDLAQLLVDSPGLSMEKISGSFTKLHPERTSSASKQHHYLNRSWFEAEIRRLKRKGKKEHRVEDGSVSESDSDMVEDDARPSPAPSSSIQNQQRLFASSSRLPAGQGPSRDTTIEQPLQPVSVASSSSHTASFSVLSHPSRLSHPHHQHLPRPFTPSYDPGTDHQPQPNLPSPSEPDAFRTIGVPPSSLAPKACFCFFCGTNRTSCWYIIHELVGWREAKGEKIVSTAPSRRSCNACYSFQLRKTKEPGVPKEVWERGEQTTKLWATEQLLIRGMRMRGEVVEGR